MGTVEELEMSKKIKFQLVIMSFHLSLDKRFPTHCSEYKE